MRLIRRYLFLGILLVIVIGAILALVYQQQYGLTPISVNKKKSTELNSPGSLIEVTEPLNDNLEDPDQAGKTPTAQAETDWESESIKHQQVTYSALQFEADSAIEDASYEKAANALQELVHLQKSDADARVLYKLGVCREALGDGFSALQAYQRAINTTYSQPLQSAARLGQCRIWLDHGKVQPARDELYTMLLDHRGIRSEKSENRLFNQLALAAVKNHIKVSESGRVLTDSYIHLPVSEIVVEDLMRELVQSAHHKQSFQTPITKVQDVVHHVVKLDETADGIILSADSVNISAAKFLREVANSTGTNLQIDESVQESLNSKTLTVSFQGIPFAVVLDALLVPLQLNWSQSENVVLIEPQYEVILAEQQHKTERLLKHAISSAPDHPLVPLCYMSLATLKHRHGEYQAALHDYERLLSTFPDVSFVSEAWINVGKCRLALHQQDSLEAFHLAVDLGFGRETEAIAQAYIGRIHLMQNTPRKAITSIQRAIERTNQPENLVEFRLLLAAANYLDDRSDEALKILSLCVESKKTARVQNEFAVLAGLIKNRQTPPEQRRDRDAATLLSALSHLHTVDLFGEHWQFLLAQGYQELGFQKESVQIYFQFQKQSAELPIGKRIRDLFSSKENRFNFSASGSTDSMSVPESPANGDSPPETQQAVMHYYHKILMNQASTAGEKQLALKKLGKIYQQRGEHALAIQCFTNSYSANKQPETQ